MVKFINVSQDYGKFRALYDISFEIKKGSLLALLGSNGAGKSTLMSIMTGFRPPLEGEVFINELNIFEEPEKAKSFIGYLAEIPPLYPELTVIEYLKFTGQLHGLSTYHAQIQAEESLDLLKITDRKNALIKNLSKGLKQRVGIAQSILHKPKLLVLDEPTVGLEPAQLIDFRHLIRNLAKDTNMTVVISTHILSEASELCHDIIIINEGKKIFDGTKDELLYKKDNEFNYLLKVVRFSDELMNYLKKLPYIKDIHQKGEFLEITAQEEIADILTKEMINYGAGIKSFAPLENSLEKVFLDLTINKESQ